MKRLVFLPLTFLALAAAAPVAVRPDLASMADTERAFSKLAQDKGLREAFLTYFAEDAINFAPGPVNAKAAIRSRPAPAQRPPITLEWQPMYGDISKDGDLGYLTGPFLYSDHGPAKQPPQHGAYFSIWKKQTDGTWKVEVDFGIPTPSAIGPVTETPFTAAAPAPATATAEASPDAKAAPSAYGVLDHQSLLSAEADLQHLARAKGEKGALLDRLTDDAHLYRADAMPAVGRQAIDPQLPKGGGEIAWHADAAVAATSGDLGYTYGSYSRAAGAGAPAERGFFLRVWRRGEAGKPRIVFDINSPLPPEAAGT